MADKSRSINTKIWDDPYFQELSSNEKLLFIYLLTNPMTNLLGIYEITLRRISFDIGIGKETISKHLKHFAKDKKVFYKDNFIIITNFLKNQSLNTNMKLGVSAIFNKLPISLKDSILGNDSQTLSNDYQSILNAMLKYEIEIEKEIEIKSESKIEIIYPFEDERFLKVWDFWKKYKSEQHRFSYKPISEQGALKDLEELSGGDLNLAMAIIMQSIKKGWKGLFELKANKNGQGKANFSEADIDDYFDNKEY